MSTILEIIKRRALPGVLILDAGNRLLYANREALEMLPGLHAEEHAGERPSPPREIVSLCERLGQNGPASAHDSQDVPGCEYHDPATGALFSLRAFYIGAPEKGGEPTHIMVLVERIVEKHEVDFDRVKSDYCLTKRESEVLRHICGGLTNKEIAERMFISEYTVKDHIKKVMKNMGVGSRSEVIAKLK
jgi:DNA-binding CsgD family transcriptional regulator